MTLSEALKVHTGALALDRLLSRGKRKLLRGLLAFLVVAAVIYGTIASIFALPYTTPSVGLSFVCGSVLGVLWLLEAYYNTYYFYGLNSLIGLDDRKVTGCSFDVAEVIAANSEDLAAAFVASRFGQEALLRVGIRQAEIDVFLRQVRTPVSAAAITIDHHLIIRLERLGLLLLQRDPIFTAFLAKHAVFEEHLMGSLRWIGGRMRTQKQRERWWSKDNLSKITSFGQEWSYGQTYHLQKFAKDISTSAVFSTLSGNSAYAKEKVAEIESTLARDVSANVLLVGEAGVGKMDLLMEVSRRIKTGEALQSIANKHLVVLDTARLFTLFENKQEIEDAIFGLLGEAEAAGNIILVIENISVFIKEAASIEIHIPELMDRFLASSELHVIVTDSPTAYHTHLEPLRGFTRRFQEVLIDTPSVESTVRVLTSIADRHERAREAVFTYQALTAIASSAERYIVNGVMPDKAVQLMADVYAAAVGLHATLITADLVYKIVTEKTGIPAGPVQEFEKETLLNLEDVLHQKVIGQNNAISAIARTMRRARAGIQASDRPIGSFLFLGPTGVGKTETAKALASVFFGNETAINRLDMSEYSDEEALTRLLGTDERAGDLPSKLQEHPYCVLLLDEFEKASEGVHDLFLQILDEGVFTDGRGNKVNARNAIIIATSNAGSQLIMKTVHNRNTMSILNAEIINHIINAGIFKPELINRFDSTIIFEPLEEHEQGAVAQMLLKELTARIHEQGYVLQITNKLLQALIEKGYSRDFGARPMRRLLQDLIEEKVAQKIIAGSLQKGGAVTLDIADFAPEELALTG